MALGAGARLLHAVLLGGAGRPSSSLPKADGQISPSPWEVPPGEPAAISGRRRVTCFRGCAGRPVQQGTWWCLPGLQAPLGTEVPTGSCSWSQPHGQPRRQLCCGQKRRLQTDGARPGVLDSASEGTSSTPGREASGDFRAVQSPRPGGCTPPLVRVRPTAAWDVPPCPPGRCQREAVSVVRRGDALGDVVLAGSGPDTVQGPGCEGGLCPAG